MKFAKPTNLLETQEAIIFANYLRLKKIRFTKICQETYTTSWHQKHKNKAEGLVRGFPDMALIINNNLVFIELKRIKGGKVSEEQKQWINDLNKCEGVSAFVCFGAEDAIKTIENIIKITK